MRRRWKTFAVLTAALCFCSLFPSPILAAEEAVTLTCLNIGKADCILLQYAGKNYLIDTGYEQTYAALETLLRECGVTKLDGVFLTHCHKDHAGGMEKLAQSALPIDAWYAAEIYFDVKPEKHPAYLAAESRRQAVSWLAAGDQIPLNAESGFTVLGPLSRNEDNENNNSLVLRFDSPEGSILLCGDMKEDEEGELLAAGTLSPCDVLKVGHHGDDKATTQAFLRKIQPKCALILTSTFEEPDTPSPAVLNRLAAAGAQAYVSQDFSDALRLTLSDGQAVVENRIWREAPARLSGLGLEIDMKEDLLILRNEGSETLSLEGCIIYSSKGDDAFPLPKGFILAPGQSCRIGSRATEAAYDLKWDKKRVWHEKKRDMAVLYDAWGRALAYADNGMPAE